MRAWLVVIAVFATAAAAGLVAFLRSSSEAGIGLQSLVAVLTALGVIHLANGIRVRMDVVSMCEQTRRSDDHGPKTELRSW